ncbi:MAG: universal stress protein, partial [Ilumatobacteraceae bacterium]
QLAVVDSLACHACVALAGHVGKNRWMPSEASTPLPSLQVRHVLVPLDGSEFALQAMPTARALAERFGAELQTISVAGAGDDVRRLRAFASAALDVDDGNHRALVVAGGDAADEIVRRAGELGSCVVCLSTRGRGRLHGALVGSVARSVLQRSPEGVVALGPMADNPGWSPRPRSWPEPLSVPRLVACVDGSDTSEEILPLSVAWARALGMSLTILTIIEDQPPPARLQSQSRYGPDSDADAYIAQLVQRWRRTSSDVDGAAVRDPIGLASGIRAHLSERPAGLVTMTTHARSGLQRVMLGAAAANIVHASVAPCLVVPVRS